MAGMSTSSNEADHILRIRGARRLPAREPVRGSLERSLQLVGEGATLRQAQRSGQLPHDAGHVGTAIAEVDLAVRRDEPCHGDAHVSAGDAAQGDAELRDDYGLDGHRTNLPVSSRLDL